MTGTVACDSSSPGGTATALEYGPSRGDRTGPRWHNVKLILDQLGLRRTRQRIAIGSLVFGKGHRHVTAQMLFQEATNAKVPVSLATVYNILHKLTECGLLCQVAVGATKIYFDTNISEPSLPFGGRRALSRRHTEYRCCH